MKGAIPYKDTFAAKGSDLYKILTESPPIIRDALAKRKYEETDRNFHSLTKGAWKQPKEGSDAPSR